MQNMLIMTVFVLLGVLSEGLSDGLLVLGVKVFMYQCWNVQVVQLVRIVRPYLSVFYSLLKNR